MAGLLAGSEPPVTTQRPTQRKEFRPAALWPVASDKRSLDSYSSLRLKDVEGHVLTLSPFLGYRN